MAPLGELELWSSFLFVVSRFCSAFTDHPLRFMHSHSLILSSWDPLRRRRHHRDPWKRLDLGSFGSHTSSALFSADLIVVNLLNALEPFVESGRLDRFSDLSFFLFLDRPTLLFFCSLSRASSQRSNLFSTMDKMILPFVLFVLFLSGRLEAVDSTQVATRLIPFLPLFSLPIPRLSSAKDLLETLWDSLEHRLLLRRSTCVTLRSFHFISSLAFSSSFTSSASSQGDPVLFESTLFSRLCL